MASYQSATAKLANNSKKIEFNNVYPLFNFGDDVKTFNIPILVWSGKNNQLGVYLDNKNNSINDFKEIGIPKLLEWISDWEKNYKNKKVRKPRFNLPICIQTDDNEKFRAQISCSQTSRQRIQLTITISNKTQLYANEINAAIEAREIGNKTSRIIQCSFNNGILRMKNNTHIKINHLKKEFETISREKLAAIKPSVECRRSFSFGERMEIFNKNNNRCWYCGKPTSKTELEVDHIIPISKGGTNDKDNLVPACVNCNRSKSNKMIPYLMPIKSLK